MKTNSTLITLLEKFIYDPADAETNFALAIYYNRIGQTASAVSYYIRTAERTDNDLLKYECLVKAAICFEKQGTRAFSVKGLLQHAIALLPTRPEAYFFLSRLHEIEQKEGDWFLCYTLASIGLGVCDHNSPPLITDVGYPGKYGLLFEKAVSSWWCGLCEESRTLFKDLLVNHNIDSVHRAAVITNLKYFDEIGNKENKLTLFDKEKYSQLKLKFPGSEKIEKNFSESYQDMFVLTMLNGKRKGTYLEIGAADPFYGNNTVLLEQNFEWTGVSLDIDQQFIDAFSKERKNPCLLKDATSVNYEKFLPGLDFPNNIDYLQLDCDPPNITYKILLSMPFEKYQFAVITYEHDYYCDESKSFREKSRKYLESFGYVMVAGDIAPDEWRNYEDWWIHPDLIDPSILEKMKLTNSKIKKAEDYMFGKITDDAFDWGEIQENQWFLEVVKDEIFVQDVYQKFFKVEEGDVVLDVGASVGPFTYSIIDKKPSKVICLEPSKNLYETLTNNLKKYDNVICVNKAVAHVNTAFKSWGIFDKDVQQIWGKESDADGITFKTLINTYSIDQIDFLKTDCEGGEYDMFTDENKEWVFSNVKKIAGEFHLSNEELKTKFRKFRDTYLKDFKKIEVFSMDNVNIKWDLWNDHFIDYYGAITIYIDNR
jgi:FkbM family methyltransferase